MGIQECKPICKIFSWIFIFTSLNFIPGIHSISLQMSKRVAVALTGENISIDLTVNQLINESGAFVVCFSPRNTVIHRLVIPNNAQTKSSTTKSFLLRNLNTSFSGQYRCEIQDVKVYWSLMVRENGYKAPENWGIIIVGALTAVMGISSMVGSLYILKWNGPSKRGSRASKGEVAEGREEEEDPTPKGSMATAPASVYASLEIRPRSIYDTLEPSAARRDTGQGRETSSSSQETKEETPRDKQKDETPHGKQKDESVYENF